MPQIHELDHLAVPAYTQTLTGQTSVREIIEHGKTLANAVTDAVDRFGEAGDPYLLLRGLPLGQPDELLLLLTGRLAFPLAHEKEGGPLIMAVRPTDGGSKLVPAYNNALEFDLHSELPYLREPPDYLALLCITNAVGAATLVARVDKALESVTAESAKELHRDAFRVLIPPHFGHSESHAPWRPLIEADGADVHALHVRFDQIQIKDTAAMCACADFYRALRKAQERIVLQPGDMLILNNRRVLHGRDSFSATNDGSDRELRRVYLRARPFVHQRYDPGTCRVSGF